MSGKYPTNPEIPALDPASTMLYGMMIETRRELLDRINGTGDELRHGLDDIKNMLSEGKETFGRHDERLKNSDAAVSDLKRRVDDVESDVQRAFKNPSGLNKILKGESGSRDAVNKDLRVKMFNTLIIAAVAAIGSGIGALILAKAGIFQVQPTTTTSSTTTSTSTPASTRP